MLEPGAAAVGCSDELTLTLEHVDDLLASQRRDWPLLRQGFEALQGLRVRTFDFGGFVLRAQFNPGRLGSVSAKVDAASVGARPCFLCPGNRPPEQRGIEVGAGFVLLCNPFPIFRDHLTVPHLAHREQALMPHLGTFLALLEAIGERYVLLYNGPRCGASAPDHVHWQAGEKGFLPMIGEFGRVSRERGRRVFEAPSLRCTALERYLRTVLVLEARDRDLVGRALAEVLGAMRDVGPGHRGRDSGRFLDLDGRPLQAGGEIAPEPMLNLLATREGEWMRVFVLLRARHRPSLYDHPDPETRLLLSPGAVDLGGVCIVPLERDFERLGAEHLAEIMAEVSLSEQDFGRVCERVSKRLCSSC